MRASRRPFVPWFGSGKIFPMLRNYLFSIDRRLFCYVNGFRNQVQTIGKVEKSDVRLTNMIEGKYLNKCPRPVKQNLEIFAYGKNKFSRKLGNLIPIIVTIDHFPVTLFILEIIIFVSSSSLTVG